MWCPLAAPASNMRKFSSQKSYFPLIHAKFSPAKVFCYIVYGTFPPPVTANLQTKLLGPIPQCAQLTYHTVSNARQGCTRIDNRNGNAVLRDVLATVEGEREGKVI